MIHLKKCWVASKEADWTRPAIGVVTPALSIHRLLYVDVSSCYHHHRRRQLAAVAALLVVPFLKNDMTHVFDLTFFFLTFEFNLAQDLAANSNVQDAFVIAVEKQARERLERLSALKKIKPVDMTKLSQQVRILLLLLHLLFALYKIKKKRPCNYRSMSSSPLWIFIYMRQRRSIIHRLLFWILFKKARKHIEHGACVIYNLWWQVKDL